MKKKTKIKFGKFLQTTVASVAVVFGLASFNTINAISLNPNVSIDKTAKWVDIEQGLGKITLTENETVGEDVELADYLTIYDVSGSMPIVTVNGYEPGTYNVNTSEVVNIGCKNPNHYSVLKPGYSDDVDGWRNANHYDNNGTPEDTSDDKLLNYTSSVYDKYNWRGDKVQTFYLTSAKDFMYSRANGCYSTLDTSQEMLNKFIDKVESLDKNSRFAYVSFASDVVKYSSFTSGDLVKEYINNSTQYAGTAYGPALEKADEILDTYNGDKDVKIIFLTDGDNYSEENALEKYNALKQHHPNVEIYAVTADYAAQEDDDITKIGDKYIYVDSNNVDETVQKFLDYSLDRKEIKASNKVYTDVVSDYFDVIVSPSCPMGAYTTNYGNRVVWNIPQNDTNEQKEYKTEFYIKLKDEYRTTATDRYYNTNSDTSSGYGAVLNYQISGGENDGELRSLYKETPQLPYGLQTATVQKVWEDFDNRYGTRPDNIEVNLTKNGDVVASKKITGTTASFEGYTNEDGNINVYSVLYDNNSNKLNDEYSIVETSVDNYKSKLTGSLNSGYTLTNTLRMLSELEVRYVDTEGREIRDTDTYKGYVGQDYITNGPEIYGYKLVQTPENATGTYAPEKTTVTYVYENLATDLVVQYIYKKDGTILESQVLFGLIGNVVKTTSKEIDGYVLIESPDTDTYTLQKDRIYVKYYYAKKNKVVTKYVDEVSGDEIDTPLVQEVVEDSQYATQPRAFDEYTCTGDSKNTTGVVDGKDVEVVYYYRKNTAGVDVRYIDQVTRGEIATSKHLDGLEDESYETEPEKVEGYELVVTPENYKGKFKLINDDVVYEYRKLSKLTVYHIDANTEEEIADEVVTQYKEGDVYEGYPTQVEGYELYEVPDETTGTMGREDVEMTFKYKRISAGLVVKYVDEMSEQELDEDTFNGNVGDVIELVEKKFDGYELSSRPDEDSVQLEVEPLERTFYYKKKSSITVKGVVEQTGEVLYEDTKEGLEGDPYTTEPEEREGYDIVQIPENKDGNYGRENEDVVYVYSKIAGDLVVKYIDVDTEDILDTYTVSGHVDDEYLTEKRDFDYYDYLYVVGKEKGVLKDEEQEVDYYYERKKGKVVVVYEYKDGTVVEQEEFEGRVGDPFTTQEKTFEDYVIVQRPDSTDGTYVEGTVELKYLLDDPKGKITVNFVDTDGNPLAATIYTEDYVGEDYYLEAPEIEGYTRLSDPIVQRKYEKGEIVIDIVYEKNQEVVVDPEPQEPTNPDNPQNPDKPQLDYEAVEQNPNPSKTPNTSTNTNQKQNTSEIAKNPKTADINVIVYLVAFIGWVAAFVRGMIKKEDKETVVKIK